MSFICNDIEYSVLLSTLFLTQETQAMFRYADGSQKNQLFQSFLPVTFLASPQFNQAYQLWNAEYFGVVAFKQIITASDSTIDYAD